MERIFLTNNTIFILSLNILNKFKLMLFMRRDEIINIILFTKNILLRESSTYVIHQESSGLNGLK